MPVRNHENPNLAQKTKCGYACEWGEQPSVARREATDCESNNEDRDRRTGMALFLSSFEKKIDKKGRVSVPSTFRAALSGAHFNGIVI